MRWEKILFSDQDWHYLVNIKLAAVLLRRLARLLLARPSARKTIKTASSIDLAISGSTWRTISTRRRPTRRPCENFVRFAAHRLHPTRSTTSTMGPFAAQNVRLSSVEASGWPTGWASACRPSLALVDRMTARSTTRTLTSAKSAGWSNVSLPVRMYSDVFSVFLSVLSCPYPTLIVGK